MNPLYTPPTVHPSPTDTATQSVGSKLSCSAISNETVFLPSTMNGFMAALRLYQPYLSIAALESWNAAL